MRKITLFLLMAVITGLNALAVPAYPVPVPMPQPDGTMVSIKLVGDEYYHYNTTADGYTVMLNESGAYVYAVLESKKLVPSDILAHDEGSRNAQELAFLQDMPKHLIDGNAQMGPRRIPADAPLKAVDLSDFDWDNFHGLVILIDFTDRAFSMDDPHAFYDMLFNTENLTHYIDPFTEQNVNCVGSVYDYFVDQSNGIFKPHFDIFGPYHSTYKARQGNNYSQSIFRTTLAQQADKDIDFTNYDGNHDGKVDMVYFIVAGYSSSYDGNNEGYLWPHESQPWDTDVSGWARLDNMPFDRYSSSTEFYGWESNPSSVHVDGIGTICHEFSHVLGIPDFYDTDYSLGGGQSTDPGPWDLMASGGHNDEGRTPAGYTLYERYALGWLNPEVIEEEGEYKLNALNSSREGYILRSADDNVFFTIENRQRDGWDKFIPGHGLIVTRVDKSNDSIWLFNKVNCDPEHNYFEIMRANGSRSMNQSTSSADAFPGTKNVTSIGNETLPSLRTREGLANDFEICDIAENDGVITFKVVAAGKTPMLKEDFEAMPVTTSTSASNVTGNFTTWDFSKANVSAPGATKAVGNNAVAMKLTGKLQTKSPVNLNVYEVSLKVFNPTTTLIKYKLEYSIDDGATWTRAMTPSGNDSGEVLAYTDSKLRWSLNLTDKDAAIFRITQYAGNKTTYVDDFTLWYSESSSFAIGDVNGDGEVNIADVNTLINIILSGNFNVSGADRADVNNDGEIGIADVNELINIILNN